MPYHCAHCSSGFLQSALTIERAFSCCSELASVYVTKIHRSGAKKRWNLLQWFEAAAIKVPVASEGEITLYSLWSLGCSFFLDKTSSVRFHLFFFFFIKYRAFKSDIPPFMDAAAALAWMGASRNSRPSCQCDVEWLAECFRSVCGPGTRPLPQYVQFGKRDVTIFPPEGAAEKLVNSLQQASSSLRYTAVTRCFFVFVFCFLHKVCCVSNICHHWPIREK